MNPLTPDKSRSAVGVCSLLVARCSFALFLLRADVPTTVVVNRHPR